MRDRQKPTSSPRKIRQGSAGVGLFLGLWPLWLIAALGIAALILLYPFGGKALISFGSSWEASASDLVLDEVKDVYRFSSVECLYRVVFPYDFMSENLSSFRLLQKIQAHLGKDPKTFLDPAELEYLNVLKVAQKFGLNLGAPDYHFLVGTVVIRAGFSLDGTDKKKWIAVSEKDGLKSAELFLPAARILDVQVEDPVREDYPYPDVPVSPEGWKEISALLASHAQGLAEADGILEKARNNASGFLERLLLNSGFSSVTFSKETVPSEK